MENNLVNAAKAKRLQKRSDKLLGKASKLKEKGYGNYFAGIESSISKNRTGASDASSEKLMAKGERQIKRGDIKFDKGMKKFRKSWESSMGKAYPSEKEIMGTSVPQEIMMSKNRAMMERKMK